MATPAMPVTPAAQKQAQQPTPTGSWRHPQFDEITRRQYATNFDDRNIRQVALNGSYFVGTYLFRPVVLKFGMTRVVASPVFHFADTYASWSAYLATALRILFAINIFLAFLPLIRRYWKDDIADIPLTPSQRLAMGLDPNVSTPQTPGSAYASPNYVTPPRYQKSTPRTSMSNQGDQRSSESPLSATGSPRGFNHSTSNSPFSPNGGSPLFQRAVGGASTTRRLSYDRHSPLASSLFGDSSASTTPGTPTPSLGKASVGLNNKWLYERGRAGSRSGMFA